MEDAVQALMMAFAVLVFVIAFTITMYMFSQVTTTAETLTFYADSTAYYDNIKFDDESTSYSDADIKKGLSRVVSAETIIPTLYRYADEEFCVKIYANKDNLDELTQLFDLDTEVKIQNAASKRSSFLSIDDSSSQKQKEIEALNEIYYDEDKPYYMFGAPWGGLKEDIKQRIDFFINGDAGYINNAYVNYKDNKFYVALQNKDKFKETFVSYSWSGETLTTEDGDTLITGNAPKDKIVIIYQIINE